jgi:hypothetical protein
MYYLPLAEHFQYTMINQNTLYCCQGKTCPNKIQVLRQGKWLDVELMLHPTINNTTFLTIFWVVCANVCDVASIAGALTWQT